MNINKKTRRQALLDGGALAAASLAAEGYARQRKKIFKRKSPSSEELMEIGIITATPGMSHIHSIWGPLINPTEDPWTRLTGMVITKVWDKNPDVAKKFADLYDCDTVENYYDMAGKVDGVIISCFAAAHYYYELAKPYLDAGTPVFINRPFAYSMKRAHEIVEHSKITGTPIMCGDTHEYVKEVNIIREKVKTMEPLEGVQATNSMSDYASHGIHGIYWLNACLGSGVQAVSYITEDWRTPNGVCVLEYAPRVEGGKIFYANLHQIVGNGSNASITLYAQRSDYFKLDFLWEQSRWDRMVFMFLPPLLAMQKMFESGRMPETHESILEKTKVFLSGFYSAVEKGGEPVRIAELPHEWVAPGHGAEWGKGMF
ncbi:Gfo/Idh/MocA family oxidoreductase [Candidatus Omnitrophota bacterium]